MEWFPGLWMWMWRAWEITFTGFLFSSVMYFMLTGLLQSLLIGFCGAAGLHIAIIVH
jgi:hypothetical protein